MRGNDAKTVALYSITHSRITKSGPDSVFGLSTIEKPPPIWYTFLESVSYLIQ